MGGWCHFVDSLRIKNGRKMSRILKATALGRTCEWIGRLQKQTGAEAVCFVHDRASSDGWSSCSDRCLAQGVRNHEGVPICCRNGKVN